MFIHPFHQVDFDISFEFYKILLQPPQEPKHLVPRSGTDTNHETV